MTRQFALDFEHRLSYDGENFLLAPSNADAVAWIDRFPHWPGAGLALSGEAGSGKTHLSHVLMARLDQKGGYTCLSPPESLTDEQPYYEHIRSRLAAPHVRVLILDEADGWMGQGREEALFHIMNMAKDRNCPVLVIARDAPAYWPVALADLHSRLKALAHVTINPADDSLLFAVLLKHFTDRQLSISAQLPAYIIRRVERSFQALGAIVEALDHVSLREKKPITIALARHVIDELTQRH